MKLRDKELWLQKHGVMTSSIDATMHRVNWTPTYDIYIVTESADTYADALDTLYHAVKSELFYRSHGKTGETFYGSR